MRHSAMVASAVLLALSALVLTDARGLVDPTRSLLGGGITVANGVLAFKAQSSNQEFDIDVAFNVVDGMIVSMSKTSSNTAHHLGDLAAKPLSLTPAGTGESETISASDNTCKSVVPYLNGAAGVVVKDPTGRTYYISVLQKQDVVVLDSQPVMGTDYAFVMGKSLGFVPTPVGPTDLGCWADQYYPDNPNGRSDWWQGIDFTQSRAFPHVQPAPGMTQAMCAEIALLNKSPYFGIEKGTECWFGDLDTELGYIERFNKSDGMCDAKCDGDKSESCGGSYHFNLFSIVIPGVVAPKAVVSNIPINIIGRLDQS